MIDTDEKLFKYFSQGTLNLKNDTVAGKLQFDF